jgi:peroxiredoxin Q/BCP
VVLGVSKDSLESHKKFKKKNRLNFPLLSDSDSKVIRAFGAVKEKTVRGKKVKGTARTTYVIDEAGKVLETYANVKVDGHARAVLDALK